MDTRILGNFGEDKSCAYLRKKGYRIVERNYSSRFGEIDIIAESSDYLVFVEVKLRKNDLHGEAKEFVDLRKQKKIIKTASFYLSQHETEKFVRFDVIEVYTSASFFGRCRITHIENAFM